MTTMVILALVLSASVAIIGPLLRAQGRAQAKTDTVDTAAAAIYRIERDLRQTYYASIWECTTGSTPTCQQNTAFGSTNAVVLPTAYSTGTGQFMTVASGSTAGMPDWQGVMVYWVDSAGDLNVAFDKPSGFTAHSHSISQTAAVEAISDVTAAGGMEVAHNVQQLLVAVPDVGHRVTLQVQALSTINGSQNETTYTTDLLARQSN